MGFFNLHNSCIFIDNGIFNKWKDVHSGALKLLNDLIVYAPPNLSK